MEHNQRFALSDSIVHRRCATESAEGADERGDDRFGVFVRGGTGPSRRRTFYFSETLPRIHRRYDRAIAEGAHHQQQLEILWRSLTSGNEETADQGEGCQPVQGGGKEDGEESCTYCGRALDDFAGESEDDHVQVSIPCAQGGLVHVRCMLDRAKHLVRGNADPRPCVACRFGVTGRQSTSPPGGVG